MNLKPTALLTLLCLVTLFGHAQISAGLNLSAIVPVGETAEYVETTFGPGIDIHYKFNDHWGIGACGANYNTHVNYDGIDGNYGLSAWGIYGSYTLKGKKWQPFITAGATVFFTNINAVLERNIKLRVEDWFYGHSIKLGTNCLISEKLTGKAFVDIGTFYLRDTYNVRFFKDAITDDDLRNSVFPRSTTFASLNLGLYYSF